MLAPKQMHSQSDTLNLTWSTALLLLTRERACFTAAWTLGYGEGA